LSILRFQCEHHQHVNGCSLMSSPLTSFAVSFTCSSIFFSWWQYRDRDI